jgi:hypothetical protein
LNPRLARRIVGAETRKDCRMRTLLAMAVLIASLAQADAQGLAAGERARGEGRCPVGQVGEAAPGGYRCVPAAALPPQQGVPVAGRAAGAGAQEVSRGAVGGWPFLVGGLAIIGGVVAIAASQNGGSTAPAGTR